MVPVAGRTRGGNQPQRPAPRRAPHESKSRRKAKQGHQPQRKAPGREPSESTQQAKQQTQNP
eukprot:14694949-Alexandrium_andersonii.AAC.1